MYIDKTFSMETSSSLLIHQPLITLQYTVHYDSLHFMLLYYTNVYSLSIKVGAMHYTNHDL